ncbi:MAG: beta-N-acetylhexosaminidase [Lentisphaerae bacterium]|nr:beta-N-acetylhexosaminidase [Lentisphaerota bacterium]
MTPERLVHLDFKGAPPKVAYLQAVFPLMRRWGATGLCIEWEDMLPYDGPLRVLRSPYAYSPSDVRAILTAARRARLTVVPLIQTFGHLEYLLKHPAFAHLREQYDDLQNLCPSQPDARPVITDMLDQVLALHPGITTIHIGGDEVRALGKCPLCQPFRLAHGRAALYLKHVTPLLTHLRDRGLRALIWDDMFREWPVPKLRALGKLAEPVVWDYGPDLTWTADPALWTRYARAGIKPWGASAFKGAGGEDISWPWFEERIHNHAAWAAREKPHHLQGVILTGWSRHSHYYPLCETLPATLPSLALSLDVLRAGRFTDAMRRKRFAQLGIGDMPFMHGRFEDIIAIPRGRFPGADVFSLVGKLQGARQLVNNSLHHINTVFPDRNGGRWQPFRVAQVVRDCRLAARVADEVGRAIEAPLRRILFPADVREFMDTKVRALARQARTQARHAAALLRQAR